jgi:steroid delta-isomerase-like uncharacterized protein
MRRFAVVLLLCSAVLLSLLPAAAQEATPATECQTTTPEQNKVVARRWFEALAAGAPEDLAALAAPDVVYHDSSPQKEQITGGAADWARARQSDYPDLEATVEQIVAEGDMVATLERFKGTQQGDVEEGQGVPATGIPTEWVAMTIFRIECGKVDELWSVADQLSRLMQMGVITPEDLQSAAPVATPAP